MLTAEFCAQFVGASFTASIVMAVVMIVITFRSESAAIMYTGMVSVAALVVMIVAAIVCDLYPVPLEFRFWLAVAQTAVVVFDVVGIPMILLLVGLYREICMNLRFHQVRRSTLRMERRRNALVQRIDEELHADRRPSTDAQVQDSMRQQDEEIAPAHDEESARRHDEELSRRRYEESCYDRTCADSHGFNGPYS